MDQITTDLWISDAPSIRNLPDDHRFETVLTLGYFDRLGYECPQPSDTGDKFVFPDSPDHEYADFAAAVDYLRDRLNNPADCPVLVHCQAGVSRSGAVCATAVAVERSISFADGYKIVQDARDKVDPILALRQSAQRYINALEDGL
jgi:protein-tyrosine phosphatase